MTNKKEHDPIYLRDVSGMFLDFFIASQNHFRDKDPSEISMTEAMEYIDVWVSKKFSINKFEKREKEE